MSWLLKYTEKSENLVIIFISFQITALKGFLLHLVLHCNGSGERKSKPEHVQM